MKILSGIFNKYPIISYTHSSHDVFRSKSPNTSLPHELLQKIVNYCDGKYIENLIHVFPITWLTDVLTNELYKNIKAFKQTCNLLQQNKYHNDSLYADVYIHDNKKDMSKYKKKYTKL